LLTRVRAAHRRGEARTNHSSYISGDLAKWLKRHDMLPASVIEEALEDHIRSWLDAKLLARRDAEIERDRALL
jgi:hypothetical protein